MLLLLDTAYLCQKFACIPTSLPLEFLEIAGINLMSDHFEAAWTYMYINNVMVSHHLTWFSWVFAGWITEGKYHPQSKNEILLNIFVILTS